MISIKSKIFNYLSKAQKSDFCHYINSFVKKQFNDDAEIILSKIIENETYYLEINSTRFEWLAEYINNDDFINDLNLFIKDCQKKFLYKEKQKPILEKQKIYLKEQRKKASELKMKKEPPTKKQISYFKSLCKKYNVENIYNDRLSYLSKYDLKNAISALLEENHDKEKSNIFKKLEEILSSDN